MSRFLQPHMKYPKSSSRRVNILSIAVGGSVAVLFSFATLAHAASSWNPVLLVNTESFQTIDEGDGTTNIEIRFGQTLNEKLFYDRTGGQFVFTRGLRVNGNLSATGSITASGAIATDANTITINNKDNASDDVLNFGNQTAAQTLKYLHAGQKFQFSKDVVVKGNISGSTLTVDGSVTLKGATYNFPTNTAAAGSVLKNDGSNNLTWGSTAVGNSSGGILALQPAYPGATYFGSGTALVGTLLNSFDAANKENYYHWVSSKSSLQDYWIAVRVKVPKNFTAWDGTAPITFRYRTLTNSSADNLITIRLLDTGGNIVGIAGNVNLVSSTGNAWTTGTITGVSDGTFMPGGHITLLMRLAAKSTGSADMGTVSLNWSTSVP